MVMEDIRRLVGRNFGRLRREKGLTQEEVAERSGLSQQYLSGLERGGRNPTVVTLQEIATALEVSFLELLRPQDDECKEGGCPSPVAPIR